MILIYFHKIHGNVRFVYVWGNKHADKLYNFTIPLLKVKHYIVKNIIRKYTFSLIYITTYHFYKMKYFDKFIIFCKYWYLDQANWLKGEISASPAETQNSNNPIPAWLADVTSQCPIPAWLAEVTSQCPIPAWLADATSQCPASRKILYTIEIQLTNDAYWSVNSWKSSFHQARTTSYLKHVYPLQLSWALNSLWTSEVSF